MSYRLEAANSEYLTVANISTANGVGLMFWFKVPPLPASGEYVPLCIVYGSNSGFTILIDSNGRLRAYNHNADNLNGAQGATVLVPGDEHCLYCSMGDTFDPLRLYLADVGSSIEYQSSTNFGLPATVATVQFGTNQARPRASISPGGAVAVALYASMDIETVKLWGPPPAIATIIASEMGSHAVATTTGSIAAWPLDGDLLDSVGSADLTAVGTVTAGDDLPPTTGGGGPGVATQLAVATQPAGAVDGAAFTTQPVVEIRDENGDVVTTDDTTVVTAAIFSGSGALIGTTTATAVDGIATFADLGIDGTGAHTIRFTATGLASADSSSVTVAQAAAVATSIDFDTQPGGAVTGQPFTTQPVVHVFDQYGQLMEEASGDVTLTINTGGGALDGDAIVAAVAGVATFVDVGITGTGAHRLQAAYAALSIVSDEFTVSSDLPTTGQLTAVAKNKYGRTLTGKSFSYASSNEAAATVDAAGLVSAVAAGTADVTATCETIESDPCAVTVT